MPAARDRADTDERLEAIDLLFEVASAPDEVIDRRQSCQVCLGTLRMGGEACKLLDTMTPFACDMTAIPAEQRGAHHALIRRLMTEAVEEIRELPNGLAFRFPAEEYNAVTELIGGERLCCPFLAFSLEVSPERGSLLLRLTGAQGVKEFIRAELQIPLFTRTAGRSPRSAR
jgi:hypothetical protein